jgi:thiopurine S-methyltransferase
MQGKVMQPDFWITRWERGETGFHQDEVNPWLRDYWPRLHAPVARRVFVPLCGKSLDMWWLRQQDFGVLGVELSRQAVEAFFAEAGITPAITHDESLERFESGDVALLCGDFFALRPQQVAGCAAIYDRASLIALPPSMRQDYAAHLSTLFPQGVRMLLVTLDYPQHEMEGPPFAVSDAEVRALYAGRADIELLASRDVLAKNERFRQRGITRLHENAYLINLKPCDN